MRARNSDARTGAVAAFLCACALLPPMATAGDDVDYSAPYLVVEDGKLVTKYPAREHTGDPTQPATEPQAEPGVAAESGSQRWLVVAIAAGALVAGLFWLTRRRARA